MVSNTLLVLLTCSFSVGFAQGLHARYHGPHPQISLAGREVLHAINLGGDSYVDSSRVTWVDDASYEEMIEGRSRIVRHEGPLRGNDTELYLTERSGPSLVVYLPLSEKGTYTVVLKFAEVEEVGQGSRVFDIKFGKTTVVKNFDVARVIGIGSPFDLTIPFEFSGRNIVKGHKHIMSTHHSKAMHVVPLALVANRGKAKLSAVALVRGVVDRDLDIQQEKAVDTTTLICGTCITLMLAVPVVDILFKRFSSHQPQG